VPRPSRTLRRAGTANAWGAGLVQMHKSCVGSTATRPCKERKDGAPAVSRWEKKQTKGWATRLSVVVVFRLTVFNW